MKINKDGFSFVELMISVAIIGILAAIAIPSYRNYVTSAREAKAEAELLQLPVLLEQYRAESLTADMCPASPCTGDTFTEFDNATTGDVTGISAFLPGFIATESPTDGINYTYNITFTGEAAATLTLTLSGDVARVYTCYFPSGTCD